MLLKNFYSTSFVLGVPIVLGSFLLFQIQPLITKTLLPTFGGSPVVWTIALVFFQGLLFVGYVYAHIAKKFGPFQYSLHALLLVASFILLMLVRPWNGVRVGFGGEVIGLLIALGLTVGMQYTILSSTSPLIQRYASKWSSLPYRYYALSNAASLIALLSFPILELFVSLPFLWLVWCTLFFMYIIVTLRAVMVSFRDSDVEVPNEKKLPTSIRDKLSWLGLSAVGSLLLVSVSTVLTQDMVAAPLIWIIPLCWYLLSFILTFESDAWINPRLYAVLTLLAGLGFVGVLRIGEDFSLSMQVVVSGSLIFCGCMLVHGYLAKIKPVNANLTNFYVWISLGGLCGGLLSSIVAPLVFPDYFEFHIALVAIIAISGVTLVRSFVWNKAAVIQGHIVPVIGAAMLIVLVGLDVYDRLNDARLPVRNFYGVLRVREYDDGSAYHRRVLSHGTTKHGAQFLNEDRRQLPTTYYGPSSGFGRLMKTYNSESSNVGIVGLGVGTAAAYGSKGDTYQFYEINPEVVSIAARDFTYLSSSSAFVKVHLGDARLVLERQEPQGFDVLVLDAFSGDAVPAHLLTLEAFRIYERHLKQDGVLAIHTSNRYIKLVKTVSSIGSLMAYKGLQVQNETHIENLEVPSEWVLLSKSAMRLDMIKKDYGVTTLDFEEGYVWTDDKNSLIPLIRY